MNGEEPAKPSTDAAVEEAFNSFPVKCDHCDWTGIVSQAVIVEGKAQCPKCKGSLAANRPVDRIQDALRELVNLEDSDF